MLAIGVFRCALIGEDGLLSIFLADAGRELDGEAGLATELHRHCNLRVLHLLLIVCRPLGIAYAAFVAEVVIEFLGDVRRKWSNEDDEAVEDFTRVTLLQFANGNHECRDAGVVRESLYVARNLLDELMERLLLLGSRRIVGNLPLPCSIVEESPELLEETVASVDTVGVPRLGLLHRTEEHLIHTESVGTIFLHNHVRVYHVEHGLRHLFDSPSADVLTIIIEDKFSIVVVRAPVAERFHIEDVPAYDVDIDVDRSDVITLLLVERYEGVGVLDTIYEVGATLNHALIDEFLERLILLAHAEVEEELVPEA